MIYYSLTKIEKMKSFIIVACLVFLGVLYAIEGIPHEGKKQYEYEVIQSKQLKKKIFFIQQSYFLYFLLFNDDHCTRLV